ncbi:MAG: polymer-forming cytoskeletal protein [Elusimicrobia bacterium]|nr:polymer-forming cytoskeletal protein [Elusimicrobiota bacterium]
MFGFGEKKKNNNDFGILETIIGIDTIFEGTIRTKNSIRIDGRFEGNITEANGIIIGDRGQVTGDITARLIVVGGKVTGNITAAHSLEILPKAQVFGDLHTGILSIGDSALFEGNCIMASDNGAVIELDMNKAESKKR